MDWQPIESAPKDGTWIVLVGDPGQYYPYRGRWLEQEEQWGAYLWPAREGSVDPQPTHWTPLLPKVSSPPPDATLPR